MRTTLVMIAGMMSVGLALSSDARALDMSDPDEGGVEMVKCFHPGDRHVATTVDSMMSMEERSARLKAFGEACRWGASPQVITGYTRSTTIWKGRALGMRYRMRARFDWKLACAVPRGIDMWQRVVNVADDYPPEQCNLEDWHSSNPFE